MKTGSFLLLFILFLGNTALSQQRNTNRLFLRTGTMAPAPLSQEQVQHFTRNAAPIAGRQFAILQFETIPGASEKSNLEKHGIVLYQYIPYGAYTVSITKPVTTSLLRSLHVQSILPVSAALKLNEGLTAYLHNNREAEVMMAYFPAVPFDTVAWHLARHGISITNETAKEARLLTVKVPGGKMSELVALPFVLYVDELPPAPESFNFESRNGTGGNVLLSASPGGYQLSGEGVTVGIAELGAAAPHIDFVDRWVQGEMQSDYHAAHVTGTVAGAGNVNERYKGYAPRATIFSNMSYYNFARLRHLVNDSGLVLINHSFGSGRTCAAEYSLFLYQFDKAPLDFPELLNVYAAGNSGTTVCTNSYPTGFGTINPGNAIKNGLAVGATDNTGTLWIGSSKGPAFGGRIKPEITAPGYDIVSCIPPNTYVALLGTSMSSPAVTGGLVLLNQRYRQLHQGAIPDGGLMKAVICNTATDMGNPGPDFGYGFGRMNVLRAVRSLDHQWHRTDSVSHRSEKQHRIQVPAGTAQLKVLLYWHDAMSNPLSARILTHDLDLKVITPSGTPLLPLTLDTTHSLVQLPATRKEDHWNNIEQVVIDQPVAGEYVITVRGTEIGQLNQQPYYISYDIIADTVALTFPFGNEGCIPGEKMSIRWEDVPSNTSTYTLEFSTDHGATWQLIDAAVPATVRYYDWTVPTAVTAGARVQIKRNDGTSEHQSGAFTIIGRPTCSLSSIQCPGYIRVQWPAINGATDYELFLLKKGQMEPVAITTDTSYLFSGCATDNTYWISVRARINGKPGTRAIAVSRKPDNGSCAGDISDGDLQVVSITAPVTGRKFSSGELRSNEQLTIQIRNLDDQPSGPATIQVNINNSGWVSEQMTNPIPAGGATNYIFSTPFDLSVVGTYDIKVAITGMADKNQANDTIRTSIRQIDNPRIDLTMPFIDSFATAVERTYQNNWPGLDGASRYDYYLEAGRGNLTYGPAHTRDGDQARRGMQLMLRNGESIIPRHRLTGTYNFALYDTALNNIGLRFNHTYLSFIDQKVFIRGNDSLPWILAYDATTLGPSVTDGYSPVINTSRLLSEAKQNFSSSFQIGFEQRQAGWLWSIAEIDLFDATHDVALSSIDSLPISACNMGHAVPVYVTLMNYGRQAATNLHVKYQVDGGALVDEIIPVLLPDSNVVYCFTARANLSTPGAHTIEAWIENPGDNYLSNNRVKRVVHSQPLISHFPYLEDFEKGAGNWYTEGTNSSWAYGSPAAEVIHDAASGQKAWKTNLTGHHNYDEVAFLNSPCFDLSSLHRPVISFSIATDLDYCSYFCDGLYLLYSTDGITWDEMPIEYISYNWDESSWAYNKRGSWKVATNVLPALPKVQFRFVFRSNNVINLDGAAIDDFHIYDSLGTIYNGTTTTTPIEQDIQNGNDWIPIVKDNQLIASIHPYNQNLGVTKVQLFMHEGATQHFHGQYYLNRNLLITSAHQPSDSIGIRWYFRDSEVDSLLSATNCAACTKPAHAYRFGISTYPAEQAQAYNGNIPDSLPGNWHFLPAGRVRIVPFNDGYYAEFKTKEWPACWLSNGGLDNNSYLPVRLLSYTISKNNATDALLEWSTAAEINMHHFDIEVAKGNTAFEQGDFVKTGEVLSRGVSAQPQQYSFTDVPDNKSGVYYYRIKAVDAYGNAAHSRALPVVWSDELPWQVYPNPSPDGQFKLKYQAENNAIIQISIYNAVGSLVKQLQLKGNGFIQLATIDLGGKYAKGQYLLHAQIGDRTVNLKLIK